MKKILIFGLLLSILVYACKDDEMIEPSKEESTVEVTTSIGGQITDENGDGVGGTQVTLGSQSVTTSPQGLFQFQDVMVDATKVYITVDKNGYFLGSRTVVPQANSHTRMNIKLLPKTPTGTFTSASGGTVASSDGVSIDFAANSVELDGGGTYSGTVNVAIQFINPSADDLSQIMPGDLRGENADGEDNVLETFGMAAIELTGSAGQKLNLIAGKPATLKIPLAGNALSSAPPTIPLWYFDEDKGLWMEEGFAQLVGNEYVGEVSHFSFWNVDVGDRGVLISGDVKCDGLLVEGLEVSIYTAAGNKVGSSAITDPKGSYTGYVPINTSLTVKITLRGQTCISELYNSTIGPFASASTIPTINACVPLAYRKLLKATLKDCDGNPFQYGVLKVETSTGATYYTSDINGLIERQIAVCGPSNLTVTAYDVLTGKESDPIQVLSNGSLDLGDVYICANTTFITGNIVCNDLSLENTQLVVETVGGGKVYPMSYDQETGKFSGHIDANTAVELKLIETNCSAEFYAASLGPFGKGTQVLSDINACPDLTQSRITASTVDCNDNVLPYASVEVVYGSDTKYLVSDANGLIDEVITYCNVSSLTFTAINAVNTSRGRSTVRTTASTLTLGDVDFECPQGTDYVYYAVDGNLMYSGDSTGAGLWVNSDSLVVVTYPGTNNFGNGFFLRGNQGLGKHTVDWRNQSNMFILGIERPVALDNGYPWVRNGRYYDVSTSSPFHYEKISVEYIEFGTNPGDYVAGTFVIDMKFDDGGSNYKEATVTGGFRLQRK